MYVKMGTCVLALPCCLAMLFAVRVLAYVQWLRTTHVALSVQAIAYGQALVMTLYLLRGSLQ